MKVQIFAMLSLAVSLYAQPVPSFESMPVMVKNTGPDCMPCGTWGWTQFHDAMVNFEGKATFVSDVAYYYDKNWPFMADTAAARLESIIKPGGYPTFSINQVKLASEQFDSVMAVEQSKNIEVGMNFEAKLISNNSKLQIVRYVQAKGSPVGQFELNTFITEHEYMHTQSGQTGSVAHPYVLRETYPYIDKTNNIYGKKLTTAMLNGGVYKDTLIIDKLYSLTGQWSPGATNWDLKKIKIASVLFKDGKMYNSYTRDSTYQTFPQVVSTMSHLNYKKWNSEWVYGEKVIVSDLTGKILKESSENHAQKASAYLEGLGQGLFIFKIMNQGQMSVLLYRN